MAWSPARRRAATIAVLWAVGVGFAMWSGNSHGLIDRRIDRASVPYEWRGVLFVSVLITIESMALYWMSCRMRVRSDLIRTLGALALFLALATCSVLTTVTDMPGWCYVNGPWTLIVSLMLFVRLMAQVTRALVARARARQA